MNFEKVKEYFRAKPYIQEEPDPSKKQPPGSRDVSWYDSYAQIGPIPLPWTKKYPRYWAVDGHSYPERRKCNIKKYITEHGKAIFGLRFKDRILRTLRRPGSKMYLRGGENALDNTINIDKRFSGNDENINNESSDENLPNQLSSEAGLQIIFTRKLIENCVKETNERAIKKKKTGNYPVVAALRQRSIKDRYNKDNTLESWELKNERTEVTDQTDEMVIIDVPVNRADGAETADS